MTQVVRYGRAYRYALTPKRSGTLQIPSPVAEVAGRKLTGRTLTLEVVPPSDQDHALWKLRRIEIASIRCSPLPSA